MNIDDLTPTASELLLSGNIESCLKRLAENSVGVLQQDEWTESTRDQLRWALVHLRDQGRLSDAIAGLRFAAALWPDDPNFILELLVIRAAFDSNIDTSEIDRAPLSVRSAPNVALFYALGAARRGEVDEAFSIYEGIDTKDERLDPFAWYFSELLQSVVFPVKLKICAPLLPGSPEAAVADAELISILADNFVHIDRVGDIEHMIRCAAFVNIYKFPDPWRFTRAALEIAAPRLSLNGQVSRLALMISLFDLDGASALADAFLADEGTRKSAWLAQLVSNIAVRRRDPKLERRALVRFQRDEGNIEARAAARAVEVEWRKQAIGADRPLNLFVGLFGQLRDAEIVIPASISSLTSQLQRSLYGPFNLCFGLSTWEKPGIRKLNIGDGAPSYWEVAPEPLHLLFNGQFGQSGHQLRNVFPNVVDALLDVTSSVKATKPSIETLQALLPTNASIVVDSEDGLEQDVRNALAQSGRPEGWNNINQFKMWSRISGLRSAIGDQEKRLGRKVDACLFYRCDIPDVGGELDDLICRVASPYENNIVYNDYDPHATFIDGIGDRIIVLSRKAADALFGGLDHFLSVWRGDTSPELALRIGCHEGPQSVIFANGISAIPIPLQFHIHRPRVPAAAILPALEADLAQSTDPAARTVIEAALHACRK